MFLRNVDEESGSHNRYVTRSHAHDNIEVPGRTHKSSIRGPSSTHHDVHHHDRSSVSRYIAHPRNRKLEGSKTVSSDTRRPSLSYLSSDESSTASEEEALEAVQHRSRLTIYKVMNPWRRLIYSLQRRFTGWRWSVFLGICGGSIVLLGNSSLLIAGAVTDAGYQQGVATLAKGSAEYIANVTIILHLLINMMSTLLLSASNHAMQVLSAPTREACIKAHRDRKWLEIGIPSFRNLNHITGRKRLLWALLFLSSIPLHLL
jgi:hypothetical protein